jgi:sn-glycerol 3-phosphate transport system permease protein
MFTHVPAIQSIIHSFYSTPRGSRDAAFVGLANYERLLNDPIFWQVLSNNLIYAIATIPLSIGLSLVMALMVNQWFWGRAFARLAFFAPTVLPLVAVANVWLFFYTPGFGLIDQITGLFGFGQSNLLGQSSTALWAVMAVTIWKEAGFFMIFYLAALQSLPPNLVEAARIEGAGSWRIFRTVTFPLLMPTTLFISVNAVINAFRLVDHLFLLTNGGPDNASSLLLFYIYETSFRYWDTAYGSTLTVILLLILIVCALGQIVLLDRKVHYK